MPKENLSNQRGFTVAELIITVTVMGILSAFVYSAINPALVRRRSQDSIRLTNIQRLAEGLESYHLVESSLPVDSNLDGNPSNDAVNTEIGKYVGAWPNGRPTATDVYFYSHNAVTGNFGIIIKTGDPVFNRFYKYRSETAWGKRVRECGDGTVVINLACP